MQPPITSRDNPVFKRLRSLQRASTRTAERAFVIEGTRAILHALASGATPDLVLLSTELHDPVLDERLAGIPTRLIDDRLLSDVTNTVTPQGIVAVFPWPEPEPPATEPDLTLVVDGVSDPGNLGTLLRSAAGAGANRVLLTSGSVDPYNPKVVRSAMGAHFQLPIQRFDSETGTGPGPDTIVALLDAHAPTPYHDIDLTPAIWIVVGSEAHGPSDRLRGLATDAISIPMAPGTESLNAGVAGSILLFEVARQRRILANLDKNPA